MRIIITMILFMSLFSGAQAQSIKAQKSKKAKLEREIAIIDKQLAANASKSADALSDLTLIQKKITNRKDLIVESDREIKSYSEKISQKQAAIGKAQVRVDTLAAHYSRLVMGVYKNRDPRRWYMYVLASDNLGQALRRMAYFQNLSDQLNEDAQRLKTAQSELEKESQELQALKNEAQMLKEQRQTELDKLAAEEVQMQNIIAGLEKDQKKYQQQLDKKRQQVEALNREIERLVAAAMKKSKGSKNKMVVDTKLDAEFAKNKGKLPWPADGPVVDKFGEKYHPVYKSVKLPSNNGVDIALGPNTKVCSVFEGVVRQIVVMPGYNKCVLVQHGGYFTFYCKLASVSVKAGDKIVLGQELGIVDTINGQTQLHFQVWQNNKPQNPESWLK